MGPSLRGEVRWEEGADSRSRRRVRRSHQAATADGRIPRLYDNMYRVKYGYETYVFMHTSGTIHTCYSRVHTSTSCTEGSRARPSSAHAQATPRPGSAELDLTCGSHGSRKIWPRSAAECDKAVIRSSLLHVKKYIETRHKLGALRRRPPGIRRGGVPARAATGQPALTAYVPAYMHMGRTWSEAPHLSVPGGRSQRGCPPRPRGS